MSLFGLIRSDLRAKAQWNYGSLSRGTLLKATFTDGTFAMIVYRLMQASQRRRLAPVAMIFNKINVILGQCTIGRNAQFGPGFVLIHSQGVVINTNVRGGADIKIEHQVTIGAEERLSPVLGDDVFIGAGAKVIGACRIGNNVRIGANAVVIHDVPDNNTAVGIPARNIQRKPEDGDGAPPPDLV